MATARDWVHTTACMSSCTRDDLAGSRTALLPGVPMADGLTPGAAVPVVARPGDTATPPSTGARFPALPISPCSTGRAGTSSVTSMSYVVLDPIERVKSVSRLAQFVRVHKPLASVLYKAFISRVAGRNTRRDCADYWRPSIGYADLAGPAISDCDGSLACAVFGVALGNQVQCAGAGAVSGGADRRRADRRAVVVGGRADRSVTGNRRPGVLKR